MSEREREGGEREKESESVPQDDLQDVKSEYFVIHAFIISFIYRSITRDF